MLSSITSLSTIYVYPELFCASYLIVLLAGIIFAWGKPRSALDIKLGIISCICSIIIVFSSNILLIFSLIELMAIASTLMIFNGHTKNASHAGIKYFAIHMLAGVLILTGLLGSPTMIPTYNINNIQLDSANFATYSLLLGLLINFATPPFSSWLTDSYPRATPTGSIFLSAYVTKTTCFLLLKLFFGSKMLIYVGMLMALYGIIHALIETNVRRIICFILINHLGLILSFIGYGNIDGMYSLVIMVFYSTVYTALLMLCASYIVAHTNKDHYNAIKLHWGNLKWFTSCGLIGILSSVSFPFTLSYLTKISLINIINREELKVWLMVWSGGATLSAAKLIWCIFIKSKLSSATPLKEVDSPKNNIWACLVLTISCIIATFILQPLNLSIKSADIIKQIMIILTSILIFYLLIPILSKIDTNSFVPRSLNKVINLLNNITCTSIHYLQNQGSGLKQIYYDQVNMLFNKNSVLVINYKIRNIILLIIIILILLYITNLFFST